MEIGDTNQSGQKLVCRTEEKSVSHRFATVWEMQCTKCRRNYGSNSCDAHIRKCPFCMGGKPPEMLSAE